MNVEQVKEAVAEFKKLAEELQPVADGFGFQGLALTVSSKDKLWDTAEIEVSPAGALVLTHRVETKWCRTYLDPNEVISVEFEVFSDK